MEFKNTSLVENAIETNVVPLFPNMEAKPTRQVKRAKKRAEEKQAPKYDLSKLPQDMLTRLIDGALNGGRKKVNNQFRVEGNKLVHIAQSQATYTSWNFGHSSSHDSEHPGKYKTIVAMRVNGSWIGNSSMLEMVGRRFAWGSEQLNNKETEIQKRLATLIPMIPFSVFEQANLKLSKMSIVERGPEETVKRKFMEYDQAKMKRVEVIRDIHFTGASLFNVEGKTFLFDIDRREVEHNVFNPFLVEIPKKAKSIVEAYEILKPEAVKTALKNGVDVQRQGEWFFLPVDKKTEAKVKKHMRKYGGELALRVGPNRPNVVEGIQYHRNKPLKSIESMNLGWNEEREEVKAREKLKNVQTYVYGTVKHTGREHADLKLKRVCIAIPNTAFRSFTITGDVD